MECTNSQIGPPKERQFEYGDDRRAKTGKRTSWRDKYVLSLDVPSSSVLSQDVPIVNVPSLDVPTLNVPTLNVSTLNVSTLNVPTLNVPTLDVPTLNVPTLNVPTWKNLKPYMKNLIDERIAEHKSDTGFLIKKKRLSPRSTGLRNIMKIK